VSALLAAQDLVVRVVGRETPLVGPLSLEIAPGERVALNGPSGSGKTTLLRTLCQLRPADGGRVLWQDNPVTDADVPRFRSRVIYLQQKPAFLGRTVEDDLRAVLALRVHRARAFDAARVRGWLRAAGREALLSAPVAQLSGGEGQLVALLRVLQLEPEVLCLDEPTSAMDAVLREQVETLTLHELGRTGAASLWVSHDPTQLRRIATRVVSVGTVPA
jgi:putative ABC transport system ATP-binding protein